MMQAMRLSHDIHPPPGRRRLLQAGAVMTLQVLAGCTTLRVSSTDHDPQARLDKAMALRPLVLLGEVHDNSVQHALRARAWRRLLDSGVRPALLMEQFDRERQPQIDQALATPGVTADDVILAGHQGASAGQWDWPSYRPFIEAALKHQVPVIAANVSRADTRHVMADGLAARGFSAAVPTDVLAAHADEIELSHCGLVDNTRARRMALAQVARDQFMARMLQAHAVRGAVLLAGNGHVRKDVGVARWMPSWLNRRSVAIGMLEREHGLDQAGLFDVTIVTEGTLRADPCKGMRPATPT